MKKNKIGAEQCYLALVLIEGAILNGVVFEKDEELKRWLAGTPLLANDEKSIGMKAAKRIFWLLSAVNEFIRKKNKKIAITDDGYKFFRADEFKRCEMFKESRKKSGSSDKPRYVGCGEDHKNDKSGIPKEIQTTESAREPIYVKIKEIDPKKSQGGLIYTFMGVDSHKSDEHSPSAIYMEVNVCTDCHRGSKTPEIFMFDSDSGTGFIRVGEKKFPVGPKTFVFVPAGEAHYLAPSDGEILKVWVVSPTAWKEEKDFIRGNEVSESSLDSGI